jgi:lysyl-tRNA synthetase class 2
MNQPTNPAAGSPDPTPEDLSGLEKARREKLRKIQQLGCDPWGQRFDNHQAISALRIKADAEIYFQTADGQRISIPQSALAPAQDPESRTTPFGEWLKQQPPGELVGPTVRAAGRIVLQRDKGKLRFVDIRDWTGQIQIFIGQKQVGEQDWALAECFDLGDIVGVDGSLRRTKTGELTIFAEKLHFLTKSIETPPEKHKGLTDPELRNRMRYLDLIHTEGSLERFLRRTKIVQSIRNTLGGEGFVEIEGPTLHAIAGGAAARPFITHHNALDMKLYLRIALELHLKRLLVGGVEKVYEMGRVYRNEGIDASHNPEFTMIEIYQSYGDYGTMMDLTERIILGAIKATGQGMVLPWGDKTIDFTPPFARRTYDDLFAEHTGVDPRDPAAVKSVAEKIGLETAGKHPDVIKS